MESGNSSEAAMPGRGGGACLERCGAPKFRGRESLPLPFRVLRLVLVHARLSSPQAHPNWPSKQRKHRRPAVLDSLYRFLGSQGRLSLKLVVVQSPCFAALRPSSLGPVGLAGPKGTSPTPCRSLLRVHSEDRRPPPLRRTLPTPYPYPPTQRGSLCQSSLPRPFSGTSDRTPTPHEQDAFSSEHGQALWGNRKNIVSLCVPMESPCFLAGSFLQVRRT